MLIGPPINLFAHVKWFSEESETALLEPLSSYEWVVVAVLIALGVAAMVFIDKLFRPFDHKLDENLRRFRDLVPTTVRISTALLIIYNFWNNIFFAPNISYSDGFLSITINTLLILVAIMLLFGVYARTAGAILIATYLSGFVVADDWWQMIDHMEYLAIGLFMIFAGAGALAVKGLDDPLDRLKEHKQYAIPSLKTFIGLSLVALAFSEKLANMTLANDFLLRHNWNFMTAVGMSDRNFIIMIGILEILFGLTLVLNRASRLGTLAILLAMIATASLLGIEEVFGHMFAIGLVAAVWVGPNEDLFKKRRYA